MKKSDKRALGLLALLWFLTRKRDQATHAVNTPSEVEADASMPRTAVTSVDSAYGKGWVWPVPTLIEPPYTFAPEVSSGYGEDRGDHHHAGVDILYRRSIGAPEHTGSDHGDAHYWAPEGTPVLSARKGKVWLVKKTQKGWWVWVDHGDVLTKYLHMDSIVPGLQKGTTLEAGQMLGTMGWSPVDGEQIRHLHFEVWYPKRGTVDPESLNMKQWGLRTWTPTTTALSNNS